MTNDPRPARSAELRAAAACAAIAGALAGISLLVPRLVPRERHDFDRTEVMIPMRDGVRLQTAIYTPHAPRGALPILLQRTPYGVPDASYLDGTDRGASLLAADGYVFVVQNVRGRFGSEGDFTMHGAPADHADPKAVDESTDAYDTIDWLVKNVPNSTGKVGVWGTSYPGWTTTMALLDPHPAEKCVSERAAMGDLFLNDDFHHNGAFRLSYGFEYTAALETAKEKLTDFDFETMDLYDWYLRLGSLAHVDERYFHGKIPTWEAFVAHPNRDDFWAKQAPATFLTHTTVPNLNVAGWFDQEDFLGPMDVYDSLEKTDEAKIDFLVVGPWNHGGWGNGAGRKLGEIDFGADVSKDFRAHEERAWFFHWLHDGPPLTLPEATIFETGANTWKRFDAWPPKSGTTPARLYLREDGKASFDPPTATGDDASDAWVSDPANPVPYRQRPIGPTYPGPEWPKWLVEDQRFVDHRPDVRTWATDPLDHDVVVTGDIVAELFASTSGTDADWVVKLIDVLPEGKAEGEDAGPPESMRGYELMVTSEILRGRFRDSLEHPAPVASGAVVKYAIDLHSRAHAFRAGHRIMVQVQSTWFPLYDRNPQTYVENIFSAEDDAFRPAAQRVFRSRDHASCIVLPVASATP